MDELGKAVLKSVLLVLAVLLLGACQQSWNNPYPPQDAEASILYSSFERRPKHLDPAQSYSSNEIVFTGQIYEPPLQYHYLRRPYELIPLTVTQMPQVRYLDKKGRTVKGSHRAIAYSVYEINIQKGIQYQPHPAFALNADGKPRYAGLSAQEVEKYFAIEDFEHTGSRELVVDDYIYQMKRLAHPRLHSPIYGLMSEYIVGLKELGKELELANTELVKAKGKQSFLDLNRFNLKGVEKVDDTTYRITIYGKYPQFLYWLAMPFFAPVPHEVDRFYSQPGFEKKNITLDWYPVGTGPYMLTVNNPNLKMVMEKNPNFHGERYPMQGDADDEAKGLLKDAGKPLPFIDKVVYSLERESIPSWNKFLQGYYDASGISSDSFDQAVRFNNQGEVGLSEEMKQKGIRLITSVGTSTYYMGFNMLDEVVGGHSEKKRKLRQAISIAMDYEEYISIFTNGRAIAAQGPLPPGIFGYREGAEGFNPFVYELSPEGKVQRKSIEAAKKLLAEAGYPNGREQGSGKPLVIYFDTTATGPDDKSRLDWYRKQFKKIGVQLVIRATDYNRFQDKMRKGTAQMFQWGWNADYPDPENFLFLLYGPNGMKATSGENAANYVNKEFDRLFDLMKTMENSPRRQKILDHMVNILRKDSPWIWGLHPKSFSLFHDWYSNAKPNLMANNTLKYKRIDPDRRNQLRQDWNRPILWPVWTLLVLMIAMGIPALFSYHRKIKARAGVA